MQRRSIFPLEKATVPSNSLQTTPNSHQMLGLDSMERSSPIPLQPQGDRPIVQGASIEDIEPFPEYTEPPSSAIYDTLANRNDECSPSSPTAISKANTRKFNNWVSSLPKRSHETAEGAKVQAHDLLKRTTFPAWPPPSLSPDYLREPRVTLEEMHALFAQLEGYMPTAASADPISATTVANINSHDLQLPPHGAARVNLEPQNDGLQMPQSSNDGDVHLRIDEPVPLQSIRAIIDVVSNSDCPRSLPFRDSGIHMEDDCAKACANVVTHASPRPNDSPLNNHVTDVRPPDRESNLMHVDIGNRGESAKAIFLICHSTELIIPDIWLEEEQRGAECLEHAYYDLEELVCPSAAQQAREDMLMLFSDEAESYVWNAFPKDIACIDDGASSHGVDQVQGEERRAVGPGEDRGSLGTSRMIDPFPNLVPGFPLKLSEISSSLPAEASDLAPCKLPDQPHMSDNLVGLGIAGISYSQPVDPRQNTEATNLDYMNINHPNRQKRDESTCANISNQAIRVLGDNGIERAPDPALLAGANVVRSDNIAPWKTIDNPQRILLSPLPPPTTPVNAQRIGRHPSQGLLTPSYGSNYLTLPSNTPESPCAEAKKPKRTYKKRARPNTRKQALAEAEAFDNIPSFNQSIENNTAQPLKPPEYLLAKMAKPNNIVLHDRNPCFQQADTPPFLPTNCLFPQSLIVPPLPLTPGDTTESQEFMTPDPNPPPLDSLGSAEPALPPSSAKKQKGSANKRKHPKRTLSNKQAMTVEGTHGEKLEGKRKSDRLVKKREKLKA